MKVRGYYPVTLNIDGEEITLRVKRMTMEEHSEFSTRLAKVGTPTYLRFVSRASSGSEQEKDEKGRYVIPFEKLAEQKLLELSPDKRDEFEEAAAADEAEAKKFLAWVLEQFVTVAKGLVEELSDGSERSVVEGLDFLRVFGARQDVLHRVLEAVRRENEEPPTPPSPAKAVVSADSETSTTAEEEQTDSILN